MSENQPDPNAMSTTIFQQDYPNSTQMLTDMARQIAKEQSVSRQQGNLVPILSCLDAQEEFLEEAYRYFADQSETEFSLSQVGEWLLDNFYIVQLSLRQVRDDMPEKYYRELPSLRSGNLAGYPRVYAVSREIVRQCQNHPDIERIQAFIHAYQSVTSLTMGELWALPTMLRLVLLENLVAALLDITEQEKKVEGTKLFACRPSAQDVPQAQVVANAIPSLHMLLNQDWESAFEEMSLVEQVLRDDPSGVYTNMDFDTRDRYRKQIEHISLAVGKLEHTVAQEVVHLAASRVAGGSESDRQGTAWTTQETRWRGHVGYYLLDEGRNDLEARLGEGTTYHLSTVTRLRRWVSHRVLWFYLGGIALCVAILLCGLILAGWTANGSVLQLVVIGVFGLVPAVTIAVDAINWLVIRTVPPKKLPKMDFSEGIPADCKTMVVVPAMLGSEREVDSLLQQIELHFLGNQDPSLYFALLTDLLDAPQAQMPEDDALVDRARASIRRLNLEHSRDGVNPFYLFHRERRWNPGEEHWMGWERKRGKLAEFNRLLAGNTGTSYIIKVGDMDVLDEIKYVITLDADTLLPRESAHRLVGTIAHPLNHPRIDPKTGRVGAGYTVLQPRVEIQPTSANQSLFTRIFSGDRGMDLYSRAVSDVYQDLFGEGIYVGKGIYDVAAFERSLVGRVPENSLLSHDLFEGIHGRAGLVTDILLYEDYPPHYPTYSQRLHRWIRGDWQLLPWLLPFVPHTIEKKTRNRLSALDRWKIVDNLRRSLVTPVVLALIVLGWLWLPGAPLAWTLFGTLVTAVPVLTGLLSALIDSLWGEASFRQELSDLQYDGLRWLLGLVFMPYQALIALDAITSTLVRLWFTNRHLLQWTTAAHTLRLFGRNLQVGATWMRMGGASLLAGVFAVLIVVWTPWVLVVALPLLLTWLISPQIAHWISKPIVQQEQVGLNECERQRLRHLARQTWLYYERFVGPDDHWLPPDHYQETPLGSVAHRTSPTNIGLLLLSTLGAYDLGYIGFFELAIRLHDTFNGLNQLEHYRGHLLNWYDTRSLEPLIPQYVSTVDSGNLAASLIALERACLEFSGHPIMRKQAWHGLPRYVCAAKTVHYRVGRQ